MQSQLTLRYTVVLLLAYGRVRTVPQYVWHDETAVLAASPPLTSAPPLPLSLLPLSPLAAAAASASAALPYIESVNRCVFSLKRVHVLNNLVNSFSIR